MNTSNKNIIYEQFGSIITKSKRAVINYVADHTISTLIYITVAYGVCLLLFGIFNGVYFDELTGLYNDLGIIKQSDSYIISFYASAEQDYWFFVFIGIIAWLISLVSAQKEAKNDKLITKINHFFPEVNPSSAHMRYLEKKVNELSCIAESVTKRMIFRELDNSQLRIQATSVTKLKNIHHNHDLTENFGEFYITKDKAVNKTPWGHVQVFLFDTPSQGSKELVKAQNFQGDKFHKTYNIKLDRKEVGTLTNSYSYWCDFTEIFEGTPAFYTLAYQVELRNDTDKILFIKITCNKYEDSIVELKPHEEMPVAVVFNNIRPDEDFINIKVSDKIVES